MSKNNLKKQQYDILNWYILNNPDKVKSLTVITERFDNFAFDRHIFDNYKIQDENYFNKISTADHQFLKKQISENDSVKKLDVTLINYKEWKVNLPNKNYPPVTLKDFSGNYNSYLNHATNYPLIRSPKRNALIQQDELQLPATTLSLPIFTKDGKTAFINRTYHCQGLCSSGGVEVYGKIKEKWSFLGYMIEWES